MCEFAVRSPQIVKTDRILEYSAVKLLNMQVNIEKEKNQMIKENDIFNELLEDYEQLDNCEDKRIAEHYAGLVYRLKGRHSFNNIPIHGESGSADYVGALRWIDEALPAIIELFKPEDIFNLDEFALFLQTAMRNTIKEKGQEIKETKVSKKGITGLTSASITGEKLSLAIIGPSLHPRSFNGHKVQPFQYYSQKNASIVIPIFNEYLR
ncbi:MAG: hypothetical protein EZS28_006315 [Streblomastix strix]|uniref:DDE-1 domain-containing protein n=1 Tax=Streblomastix strix TaxID=222440 RepID=A0A5J4WSN2_9EUKA|nr:MAG: hypothetical protein EZS28_006315 [Streblomastix strix]